MSSTAPSAPAALPVADIEQARLEIDELDSAVADLVARRRELSRGIQAARIATGGHRLHHSREVAVVRGYSARLGADGAALAMSVLRVCRGA